MPTRLLRPRSLHTSELWVAVLLSGATAMVGLLATEKLGLTGLLAMLGLVAVVVLMGRPRLMVAGVAGLVVLCEGSSFGILTVTSHLYSQAYKDLSVLDILVALAVLSVALDVLRTRRAVLLPRPLMLPLAILALAMVAGAITGHAGGGSLRFTLFSEHVLVYLLLLPLAVANLDIDRRQISRLLVGAMALALVKAVLGLIEIAGNLGQPVEGVTKLTYYEPTANWIIMIALLGVLVAVLARVRPPLWMLLGTPLLLACLVLSYRRSFWIAAVLGLLLVLLLGTSPLVRRVLLPGTLGVAVAIWLLGSINFQSQGPLARRVASLAPSKLQTSVQDSYRLDERANVLEAIRRHPLTGLGVTIPWPATARTLSFENPEGRQYVHFAALWFWLKLGVLGLFAYIGIILGSLMLAWRAWRDSREPLLRAFALASLCGIAGLVAIDTTASFTGVDPRFTVLLSVQVGLLAQLARTARASGPEPARTRAIDSIQR
jgi:O-antigen ligase